MKNKLRSKCLCCNKNKLNEIINLGLHSFADRFVPKKKLNIIDPKYPLILDMCNNCKFIQSRVVTDPKNRYLEIDYSYTSSNSNYSRNHWVEFADSLEKKKILTRYVYPPLNTQKIYKQFKGLPISNFFCKRGLWLPSSLDLKNKDIDNICKIINKHIN